MSAEAGALFDRMMAAIGRSRGQPLPRRAVAGPHRDRPPRRRGRRRAGRDCPPPCRPGRAQGPAPVRRRLRQGPDRRRGRRSAIEMARSGNARRPGQDFGNHKSGKAGHPAGAQEARLGRSPDASEGARGMKTLLLAASLGLSCAATPALAADQAETPAQAPQSVAIPAMLNASQRENYRSVFADLRAQNWAGAAGRLDGMANGPLARPRPGDALHHAELAPGRARAIIRLARPRPRTAPGGGSWPARPAARRRDAARHSQAARDHRPSRPASPRPRPRDPGR